MSYEITNPEDINSNILIIDEIPPYDIKDYDLFDEKDFKKYLDDIERIIRNSMEYREFVNYLREYMDMNKCSFFENVTNINSFKIKIHIHHHPLTLYDIVIIVYNKRNFFEESLEVEMVAKEVMYVHYFMMIGLIPLSETVHALVHDQLLFIPIDKVMGDWEEFLSTYSEFIPQEIYEKIERYRQSTLEFSEEQNRKLLIQTPTYVKVEQEDTNNLLEDSSVAYKIPKMNTIIDTMTERIEQIKNKNYELEKRNIVDATYDNITPKLEDHKKDHYMPIYFID